MLELGVFIACSYFSALFLMPAGIPTSTLQKQNCSTLGQRQVLTPTFNVVRSSFYFASICTLLGYLVSSEPNSVQIVGFNFAINKVQREFSRWGMSRSFYFHISLFQEKKKKLNKQNEHSHPKTASLGVTSTHRKNQLQTYSRVLPAKAHF